MKEFIDYYALLGISETASLDEIKAAYRNLVKQYHPDLNPGIDESMIQKLNDAITHFKDEETRAKYDIKYKKYKEQQRKASENQNGPEDKTNEEEDFKFDKRNRAKTQNTTNQRTTNQSRSSYNPRRNPNSTSNHAKASPTIVKKFSTDIHQAWKEIREEERKKRFFKRHAKLDSEIYNLLYEDYDNIIDEIIFGLKRGIIHIEDELKHQFEKLSHITEDTIPKYIIRNRAFLSILLAAVILISGAAKEKKQNESYESSSYSISVTTEDNVDKNIVENISAIEEENNDDTKEDSILVYREYVVQEGDTLSQLAKDSNNSVENIMMANALVSSLIKIDDILYIPYDIESDELQYATNSVVYPMGMSIEDFASKYSTITSSLVALNEEAIIDGIVVSDTLLVPNFASQEEIKERKANNEKVYTKYE